jgi:uncharacterized membrane protein (DUF106 family)
MERPWGLFIKPLAKHAWEGIKQKITKFLKKRKAKILAKSLAKKSSRRWLFVSLGILVAFVWFIWFLGCIVMNHVTLKISGWNTWFGILLIFITAILFVLFVVLAMPKSQTGDAGEKSTKFKFPKINWDKLSGFLKVVIGWLVVAWICWYAISSCTRSCNEPKVQVVQKDIGTEGMEGSFTWKEQPNGMPTGGRLLDAGSPHAFVQKDNSNEWKIVLSGGGVIDHLTWKKSEPCGSWYEEGTPYGGNWQLQKTGRHEYKGWMTSNKYPGRNLRVTLTLRR